MIALAPVGERDTSFLPRVVPILHESFGRELALAPPVPLPPAAWDAERQQYRAAALNDALSRAKQPGWERLLGLADIDLFAPGLNFVFGEADKRHGVAVMSTWRLHGSRDEDAFVRLVATEAVHELGHTYGLGHCDRTRDEALLAVERQASVGEVGDAHPVLVHLETHTRPSPLVTRSARLFTSKDQPYADEKKMTPGAC